MGIEMYFVTTTDDHGNDRTTLECTPEAFQAYKEREVELCVQNIEKMMDRAESIAFGDLHVSLDTWNRSRIVLAAKGRVVDNMSPRDKKAKYKK